MCLDTNHVQIHKSASLLSIFSEPRTISKTRFEIPGVSDITNYIIIDHINTPAGFSISLSAN